MKHVGRWLPLIVLALVAAAAAALLLRPGERAAHFEPRIGRAAPVYALASLDGGAPIQPGAFGGRPYVINFFASWCTPCRVEHPLLLEARRRGVTILGVAYKDEPAAARQLLSELGDPFARHALDPEGRFALDLGVTGVPETFVIGADGRIAAAHRGPLTEEALREEILPALR